MRITEELLNAIKDRMRGISFNDFILRDILDILVEFIFVLFIGSLGNFGFKLLNFTLEFKLC